MRALIFAALVAVAGCSVETGRGQGAGSQEADAQGYTVEVRTAGNDHVYSVTGPDGKVAAARVLDGTASMLDHDGLQQAFAAMPEPEGARAADDGVSVNAPGFQLRASGKDDEHGEIGGENGHGQVSMRIGGFSMDVNADEGGPGDDDDRARVRLTGMSERDARKFIQDQEDLTDAVKAQMLLDLGLEG